MKLKDFLSAYSKVRRDEVVIAAMSAAGIWAELSNSALDFLYVPSSMGQAPSLGLGLALACPSRRIVVINGDGSLLMNLGVLVTVAGQEPANYVLINVDNGVYQVTGCQPVPGNGKASYAGIAREAGWPHVCCVRDLGEIGPALDTIVLARGPVFVNLAVDVERPPDLRFSMPMSARLEVFRNAFASANRSS